MNARIARAVLFATHLLWISAALATDTTVNSQPVRTVLIEFFDPTQSQLAEPLTYLWYRQIYDSISDAPGAGVMRIVQTDRDQEKQYAQALISNARGDHNLAGSLASNSDAQLAVWGTLLSLDKNAISYAASITMPTDSDTKWLQVPTGGAQAAKRVPTPVVKLGRVNLSERTTSLIEHYGTAATVRCSRNDGCPAGTLLLQSTPEARAPGLPLTDGERVLVDISEARKPTGKHVPVKRLRDGRAGWLYTYHLSLTPPQAYVSSRSPVAVYDAPTTSAPRVRVMTGPAVLKVVEATLVGEGRAATRWYRIEVPPGRYGWIQFGAVRPVWAADFVHFVSGLLHYGRGRYQAAHDEMELFVSRADADQDNVPVSIAYEVMAASVVSSRRQLSRSDLKRAGEYVSASVHATPFDSRSFYMRAYTTLAWRPDGVLSTEVVDSIKSDLGIAQRYLLDTDEELESALQRMETAVDQN